MSATYWLDVYTRETWDEFRANGGTVSGFVEAQMATVRRMRAGDFLLCYLTGVSRWVGVLEVAGGPYHDESFIWQSQVFPSRVPVRIVVALDPEFGVPVLEMRDELSVFKNLTDPNPWDAAFQTSPAKWEAADGEAVVRALGEAEVHPVPRPLDELP